MEEIMRHKSGYLSGVCSGCVTGFDAGQRDFLFFFLQKCSCEHGNELSVSIKTGNLLTS